MAEHLTDYLPTRWLLLAVLSFAVVAVACNGEDGENPTPEPSSTMTATAEATPTVAATPTLTALPSPTSTSAPPTMPPPLLPSPTLQTDIFGFPFCPDRTYNHVNMELLAAQPGMESAVISEVDDYRVRVEIGDGVFLLTGWGHDTGMGIGGDPSDDLTLAVSLAWNAVASEC